MCIILSLSPTLLLQAITVTKMSALLGDEYISFVSFFTVTLAFSMSTFLNKGITLQKEYVISLKPSELLPPDEVYTPKLVLPCNNIEGECPIWDTYRNILWWLDIEDRKLYSLNMQGDVEIVLLPERCGSFALCESNTRLLLALESGFAFYYIDNGRLVRLYSGIYTQIQGTRPNDGRCDRQGRFVVGGYNEVDAFKDNWKNNSFVFNVKYNSFTGGITVRRMSLPSDRCTNSICFSLDGRRMFHCDSPSREIRVYDYDRVKGDVGDSNVFAEIKERKVGKIKYHPIPDGSIVDSSGHVWNAEWDGLRLAMYRPSYHASLNSKGENRMETRGTLVAEMPMPVEKVTCATLAGPDLDWMYITSCRGKETESGGLFVARVDHPGVPESRFCDVYEEEDEFDNWMGSGIY